ncbi:MAG: 2-phosphosulfolactate phosphatase [Gemmatimonadales bacterium]|nr:MAG: 2-phosphosulfolactate phosphatase [Gemmatimonadales bacterium]
MRVRTYFSAAEAQGQEMAGATAVVIDVIRATSTMVEALANGARAIYPTVSTEEAIRLANTLGREDTLLCGERKGLKIEGFDLGNSPREYAGDTVDGKRLVMSTTNGTRAFVAAQGAERVLAGSFLNLDAVVGRLRSEDVGEVVLVCAGKEDRFALDDALCAGLILHELAAEDDGDPGAELNDASRVAQALAEQFSLSAHFLETTAAGAALVDVGLEADLPVCAHRGRHSLVPEMNERMIHLPGSSR